MDFSKDSELKPVLVYKDPKEIIPFSNIVVPSSMRSPLWKHFGFPADRDKTIITKNRIICGICRIMLAYNKNTTNLSTHLRNKHPHILDEIQTNSNKHKINKYEDFKMPVRLNSESESPSLPKRSKTEEYENNWYSDNGVDESPQKEEIHPTGIIKKTFVKARKLIMESSDMIENLVIESQDNDDIENQYIETIDYNHINDEENETITETLETDCTDSTLNTDQSKDDYLTEEFLTIKESHEVIYESPTEGIEIPSKSPPKIIANKISDSRNEEITEQIKKFLIKDLIHPSIVDGSGFKDLMGFFDTDIPNSLQFTEYIEKDYGLQHSCILSGIESILKNQNYSLSFCKLSSSFTEISINYLSDIETKNSLENQIFCISKNCTQFFETFVDDQEKCSAFVVDFDLQSICEKVHTMKIPIIPTFSYVTNMVFEAIYGQFSAVRNAVDELLLGNVKKFHNWMQKFEYLSQFLINSSNNDSENKQIIQAFIECIRPLKNYMDVLTFERTIHHASVMKPVAQQLIVQYYTEVEMESESLDTEITILEKDMKRIIHQIFEDHIIKNPFLTMASFLDPRFQGLTSTDDLNQIRDELKKTLQTNDSQSSETERLSKLKSEKNVGLSSLFSNIPKITKSKVPKNRFDIEFRSYTEDASLEMQFCPMEWWFETESLYPTISQYVKKYFCVPAFTNNFHRFPPKYDHIACDTNEQLLWLHLNELRHRSPES
ncbi:uncharacterized protein LOC116340929 [Contarinia nasturtii]|uniref:uncharacterized protein LOC116340929 n=1 Tax=Contarinia nasturtii TaxID=265458 RepID=UPI0012D405B3|nr:uncharacterized protein LOC116340929 [Contarinia nasturtii]